jgi:hypothetical protein
MFQSNEVTSMDEREIARGRTAPGDRATIAEIWAALCENEAEGLAIEALPPDDMQSASKAAVLQYLNAQGVQEHEPLEAYGITPSDLARIPGSLAVAPDVPRVALLRQASEALERHMVVVIFGAIRSGTSALVNALISDTLVRSQFPRRRILDCFALRTPSYQLLEREAIWSLFANDEGHGRCFSWPSTTSTLSASGAKPPPADRSISDGRTSQADGEPEPMPIYPEGPFTRFLRSGLLDGGLLVLDHVEKLHNGREAQRWLENILRETGKRGTRVIIVYRSLDVTKSAHRKVLRDLYQLCVPNLTEAELGAWLTAPFFDRHREAGLTPRRVLRVTGGRPGLVRDFGRFLIRKGGESLIGWRALAAFARHQACNYAVECGLLVDVLRARPQFLAHPIAGAAREQFHSRSLETGAIVKDAVRGELRFASPILSRRFRTITTPRALLSAFGSDDVEYLVSNVGHAELLGPPLKAALISNKEPREVFTQFARILRQWALTDVCVYVRDDANAKLWSFCFGQPDGRPRSAEAKAWPLSASEWPEFARAAYTGRPIEGEDSILYLPIGGARGRVELVATGRETSEQENSYERRLRQRTVWNITKMLAPALTLAAERLASRRQRDQQRNMFHRLKAADPSRKGHLAGTLREAQCSAVAVLERSQSYWFVAHFEIITARGASSADTGDWEPRFEGGNLTRLDEIAKHPSGRGLVLSGRELALAFPRMLTMATFTTLFLRPVWLHGGAVCRLVIFMFEGSASREVTGVKQSQLSVMAPYAIAG